MTNEVTNTSAGGFMSAAANGGRTGGLQELGKDDFLALLVAWRVEELVERLRRVLETTVSLVASRHLQIGLASQRVIGEGRAGRVRWASWRRWP